MNFQELLLKEQELHRNAICNYKTQSCRINELQNPMIKDPTLVYSFYKDRACKNGNLCESYHTYDEQRRPILCSSSQKPLYYPVLCKAFFTELVCDANKDCPYAHSHNEVMYHPTVYKTEQCSDSNCPFTSKPYLCSRIHPFEPSRNVLAKEYEKLENRPELKIQHRPLLNLTEFKVNPCKRKDGHEKKHCPYFHSDVDRRRSLNKYNYCPELCPKIERSFCNCDNSCPFAKNKVEQLYHAERYKKKFCSLYPEKINQCEYENFCSFAHSEAEIKTEKLYSEKATDEFNIYKLKTIFCPFRQDHERSLCHFAHNVQDFRRDPLLFTYKPEDCPYWSKSDSVQEYEKAGCMKLLNCEKCHGWKELEYHPQFYKTKVCEKFPKCERKDCPYTHILPDKRKLRKRSSPERIGQPPERLGQSPYSKKEIEHSKKNKFQSSDFGPYSQKGVSKQAIYSKKGSQELPLSEYFNPGSQHQSTTALSNISLISGGTGITDIFSPKVSYSSKNESSDDDSIFVDASLRNRNSAPVEMWKNPKKTGSANQNTPSTKMNKPGNSPFQSKGEVSPQSMSFETHTPGRNEKKHLKLKSKNEFIPQNYSTLPQESYFPSYSDNTQRLEERKGFSGQGQHLNENASDLQNFFASNMFSQQVFHQQPYSTQQKYPQNQFVQSPFGSFLRPKDYSAPSKLTSFSGALTETREFESSENFPDEPNKLEDMFSHKIDLGTQKQPVRDDAPESLLTRANKDFFQPFTSDFGENVLKKSVSEKPKKSLYENLFVPPEEHDQV